MPNPFVLALFALALILSVFLAYRLYVRLGSGASRTRLSEAEMNRAARETVQRFLRERGE